MGTFAIVRWFVRPQCYRPKVLDFGLDLGKQLAVNHVSNEESYFRISNDRFFRQSVGLAVTLFLIRKCSKTISKSQNGQKLNKYSRTFINRLWITLAPLPTPCIFYTWDRGIITPSAERCPKRIKCGKKWIESKTSKIKEKNSFLDASSHLYNRVCPSVRPSVRWSVTLFSKTKEINIFEQIVYRGSIQGSLDASWASL